MRKLGVKCRFSVCNRDEDRFHLKTQLPYIGPDRKTRWQQLGAVRLVLGGIIWNISLLLHVNSGDLAPCRI